MVRAGRSMPQYNGCCGVSKRRRSYGGGQGTRTVLLLSSWRLSSRKRRAAMPPATSIRMTDATTDRPAWLLAFELGAHQWQRGCTTGAAQRPRERHVPARHIEAVRDEIRQAKERCGLPADAPVISWYEAGRDGFWLHRWLVTQGVANGVVDSSSIAVNRRHRRAKTDRLDEQQLRTRLRRHAAGARQVWRIVRVPSVEEADRCQLHRALTTAQRDRTRVIKR